MDDSKRCDWERRKKTETWEKRVQTFMADGSSISIAVWEEGKRAQRKLGHSSLGNYQPVHAPCMVGSWCSHGFITPAAFYSTCSYLPLLYALTCILYYLTSDQIFFFFSEQNIVSISVECWVLIYIKELRTILKFV